MNFLVYGANGYTGRLIAHEARARGLRPTLAGRNAAEVGVARARAGDGAPGRFARRSRSALDAALAGHGAVIHCAGPFSRTARADVRCLPPPAACTTSTSTARSASSRPSPRAMPRRRRRGITVLPGVGFDVVPTDCLALHLKQRLPSAISLVLAFQARGGISRGTALTTLDRIGRARDGSQGGQAHAARRSATRTRHVDFGNGASAGGGHSLGRRVDGLVLDRHP